MTPFYADDHDDWYGRPSREKALVALYSHNAYARIFLTVLSLDRAQVLRYSHVVGEREKLVQTEPTCSPALQTTLKNCPKQYP